MGAEVQHFFPCFITTYCLRALSQSRITSHASLAPSTRVAAGSRSFLRLAQPGCPKVTIAAIDAETGLCLFAQGWFRRYCYYHLVLLIIVPGTRLPRHPGRLAIRRRANIISSISLPVPWTTLWYFHSTSFSTKTFMYVILLCLSQHRIRNIATIHSSF
jgi:hypothetical protein